MHTLDFLRDDYLVRLLACICVREAAGLVRSTEAKRSPKTNDREAGTPQ